MGPLRDLRASFGSISVVVPAYNAERHVVRTLDSIQDWLESQGLPHEVIVVDDGSADGTAVAVERRGRGVRVLRNRRNRGKGHSVRRGMLAATKAWALFTDVDNSTTIDHLARFAPLAATHEVIIASRRAGGALIVRRQHAVRRFLGNTFPALVHAVALPDVHDTQCGFKAFRRDAARAIFSRLRVERFAFDVEALLLARTLGYSIGEVPVRWDNPTASTVRLSTDTVRMLVDLLATTWRMRDGAPDPAPAREEDAAPDAVMAPEAPAPPSVEVVARPAARAATGR